MSSNTKRNNPYVKKENKKKTEAKYKLKGTIVIDALPVNDPDFRCKDNVPATPMHDNFVGEPPQFDVNEPRMAVDYMKPEHRFMGSTVSQTLCDCQCKHIAFIQTFLLADVKIHMFCSSNSKFF